MNQQNTNRQIATSALELSEVECEMLGVLLKTATELLECALSRRPASPQQLVTWRALVDEIRRKHPAFVAAHDELVQALASLAEFDQ